MIFLCALLFMLGMTNAQTCRALALEGGGSHGAYEAGAVWALANLTKPGDVAWNIVSGVSAGALNSLAILQYATGDEIAMSNYLLSLWLNLDGSDSVYKEWPGGDLTGILFEKGIYDTSPLKETLESDFKLGIHRNFSVGTTNLNTGVFATFQENVGAANVVNAILCSAAPPFFFPPRNFQGEIWADGGCIINLDVFSAVERCLEITNEANIIIDMVYDSETGSLPPDTKFKSPDVLSRAFAIHAYDSSIWYTYNAMVAYPKVNYRYIIIPSESMPGGIVPLNFTKSVLEKEIQMGINDTTAALKSNISGKTIITELYQQNKQHIIYA